MDNRFQHCSARVTSLEQDGFLVKIHAQVPSDSGVSCRELLSRVDLIAGHLRRVKCCESISRGQLAFARIEDKFHRVRALGDDVEGRVAVRFIDYGHEDVLLLSDIILVDPPLSDVLTTVRPLAEEFYLDGVLLMRPLSNEEVLILSEKILNKTVSCRLRRFHPELSLIELATTNAAGDRQELFSNIVIELGFGNKCSSEDIAKNLRIKIPARADDPAMQSGRPYSNNQYSVPPPIMMASQPAMLGSPTATMLGSQPGLIQVAHSSVNARLTKFKKDAASSGSGLYSPPPQLADRKQYAVTDGRTCTTAPTLPVNSTHNAYISHVEDGPLNFTIQLKSSVEELLPKLRNILIRYQNSPITAQLIPGSVVMAKSSDETLRRGVIMNVKPETCKVYYIDFGNFEELPYSDIFQLPNTAAELSPAMAMQFCLADVKSMKITDSNKDYFARLLLGKQILIRVTERESKSPFQYCEIWWEGRSIREILMNLNSPMQYSYQYPPRGREAPVSVVYVDGPSQFFVQYRSELNVVNQIQEALSSYCPPQPRVTDLGSVSIGSPVASIFPDDQKWYRALIMGMDSTNINVFYVDYGNRAEVTPSQICLLSRDLVNKWKTQAIECCLIGFDTVTPDRIMADKMEEAVLGRSYTLRLHSILSGFRLSVDLLDEQGNSIATNMKNLLNERQKDLASIIQGEKKKASYDDDRTSQHSSSIRRAIGVYKPPLAKPLKTAKPGDSGGKRNRYQRPGLRSDKGNKSEQRGEWKSDECSKFEERPKSYSQHDDRSGGDYRPRNDSRADWKKGSKKPYMDTESEWGSSQEAKSFAKKDSWGDKQDDKPSWGSRDRQGGFRSDSDRKDGSNRFERKPFNNDEDSRNGDRGHRDRKFGDWDNRQGDRENKYGDRENKFGSRDKFGDRESKFGDRENKFGSRDKFGDRENKFGNRENKFGDRDNKDHRFGGRDNKSGDRENKFGGRDRPTHKQQWNESNGASRAADPDDSWDDIQEQASVAKPSVVISEYPHQEILVGAEYKVIFAMMETSAREVYTHLIGCDAELENIRCMIDADTTVSSRPICNAVLAMPVLARFQDDGLLYRATIKSISKVSSGQVDVLFVDYGNTAVCPLSEVFPISSELMSIPIQAVHVIVADMPTTPFPNLSACQAHFETEYLLLKPNRTTTINLEQVVEGTLVRPDGQSVAECVKNDPLCHGAAQLADEPIIQTTSSALGEAQAPVVDREIAVHPTGVVWRDQLALLLGQRLLAKVVKKLNGDNFYSIKIISVLDLIVPALSTDPLSRELNDGDDVIVAVDRVAENKLFVNYYNHQGTSLGNGSNIGPIIPMQIVQRGGVYTLSHRDASTLYLHPVDSASLDNLLEQLWENYEKSATCTNEFKVGDMCAAKSEDGNWYRARITTIVDNKYTVYYLDYGNHEDLESENLRELEQEFLCPEQCVSVVLPVTYNDVEGCFDSLGDGPFECSFIKFDSVKRVWVADLYTTGEPKQNLALKWIEEGKAETMSDVSADPDRREPWWNIKKGDRIPIIISHIESPAMFFAHRLEQSKYVLALQDEIQDLPDNGDLGDVFLAKYTEDSVWYRAVRFEDQVRFIDYGNHDPSVEMKNLPTKFIHPAKGYALPLRLCVVASGETWTDAAAQIFDNFIEKSGLEAEIVSVDFEIVVDLKSGDESLSQIFIDGGHAIKFIPPLNNSEIRGPLLKIPLNEEAPPVGKVPAVVTTFISVNDFYIQEKSKSTVLDLLSLKLEEADSFEILENPSCGQIVVAKFVDDSLWYRASVINQDPVEVLFFDYGNVSPASEFRVLPLELGAFPSLSWHCSLNMEDTPANNELFSNLVDAATTFDVSFVGMKDDFHIVQLSVDNKSPFEIAIPEVEQKTEGMKDDVQLSVDNKSPVEIAIPEVEPKTEAHVKPPPVTKPIYKDCVLAHSNGPYDFYVQTDDDHIQIDEMANALFEAGTFRKIDSVKKGDFVVAQFSEDDAYYRAVVTDVEPEVVVHFIDYGNSHPASCFHELPAPLTAIPQLAVRCSLQSPIGGWSVDAIDKFTALLNQETKSIDLKIISRGDPNIVDVDINGCSITQLLAPGAKFKPDAIPDVPSAAMKGGAQLQSNTNEEEYVPITISHVNSPSDFYYQLDSAKVNEMSSKLADTEAFLPVDKFDVGQVICGQYFDDKLWYRAKILTTEPSVTVLFLDYGNTSEVKEMKQLPDDLAVISPLCVRASLISTEQPWSEEEVNKFLAIACGSADFSCSVVETRADKVIVRLKSSEDGDVTSYLGRSSSLVSDSEYGTPEVLSVNCIVPEDQCDESAVAENVSCPVEQQVATLMSPVRIDNSVVPGDQCDESAVVENVCYSLDQQLATLMSPVRIDNSVVPGDQCDESAVVDSVPCPIDQQIATSMSLVRIDNSVVVKEESETEVSSPLDSKNLSSLIRVVNDIAIPIIASAPDTSIQNLGELRSVDALPTLESKLPLESKSNSANEPVTTDDSPPSHPEVSESLAKDESLNVSPKSSYFRLPNLKDTLLSVIGYNSSVCNKNQEAFITSPDTVGPEASGENLESEVMDSIDLRISGPNRSQEPTPDIVSDTLIASESETEDEHKMIYKTRDPAASILTDSSSSVTASPIWTRTSGSEGSSAILEPSVAVDLSTVLNGSSNLNTISAPSQEPAISVMHDILIAPESETNDSSNEFNKTPKPTTTVSQVVNSNTVLNESAALDQISLCEFYRGLEDVSYCSSQNTETCLSSSSGPVDDPGNNHCLDIDGSSATEVQLATTTCVIDTDTSKMDTSMVDEVNLVAEPVVSSALPQHGITQTPASSGSVDCPPAQIQKPLYDTVTKHEEEMSELPMEKPLDSSCRTDSTVSDAIILENTMIHVETEGAETSDVSKKQVAASVEPASKVSPNIIETRKKTPVKTLAQIKASAKPRISTGRPVSSNLKNKPSPSKKCSTPPLDPKMPSSVVTSPRSSKEKDRLIPGTVNGRIV